MGLICTIEHKVQYSKIMRRRHILGRNHLKRQGTQAKEKGFSGKKIKLFKQKINDFEEQLVSNQLKKYLKK